MTASQRDFSQPCAKCHRNRYNSDASKMSEKIRKPQLSHLKELDQFKSKCCIKSFHRIVCEWKCWSTSLIQFKIPAFIDCVISGSASYAHFLTQLQQFTTQPLLHTCTESEARLWKSIKTRHSFRAGTFSYPCNFQVLDSTKSSQTSLLFVSSYLS